MHFSDKLKVYWYTPQRTGTRSTVGLLKSLGFKTTAHGFYFDDDKKDYFFVSNIRNPYSRIVSIFYLNCLHKNNFDRSFKVWVFDSIKHPNVIESYQINYHENLFMLGRPFDKFIRQENLGHDLKSLSFIDLDVPEIKRNFEENISQNIYKNEFENIIGEKRKNWKDFYDEETSDFVFETLKEQFDLFGYKKNSWNNGTP